MRSFWLSGFFVSAAVLALTASSASAQQKNYPSNDIKVVVPSAAGSGGDLVARYFAVRLAEKAKVTVIVENKTGASGNIASQYVARSNPDGYTLEVTGATGTHASSKFLFKNLPFDPQKDFTPITTISRLAMVLVVNPNTPAKDVKELTSYLKKKDKVSYGTSSNTSLVAGELYDQLAGLNAAQVAYRSPADGLNDLLGNQIDYMFMDAGFATAQARGGKVRMLAVSSVDRLSVLPDVPSLKESGIGDLDMSVWWGVFGPAGMPKPIVDRLSGWLNEIVETPETREFLAQQGTEPYPGNPKMMADLLAKDIANWGAMLKAAKVEPQ